MRNKLKQLLPFFCIIGFFIMAAVPLFQAGYIPTHDGEYHIIRFYEFEKTIRAGYWFPRWAPGLNSGYGVPLFNFFYPFPNYLGVFYHLAGWSLPDAFKLTMATGYIVAGICCFLWLKKIFGERAGLIGAIVFGFIPYWFVDIYVRGSVGEVLAMAWVMAALAAMEYKRLTLTSIATACMLLSHNILAMVFLPILTGYGFFRWRQSVWGILGGVGLAAYFWLPALTERHYVVGLNTVDFREHFPQLFQLLIPSWGTGFSSVGIPNGEMSQQLGIITILMSMLAALHLTREKKKEMRRLIGASLIFFVVLIMLMLSVSQSLWEVIAPLQLLQYPWRLLSVVLPLGGLFTAYAVRNIKHGVWGLAMVSAAVLLAYGYARPVIYVPRGDVYYLSRREFTDGTSSLGNSFSTVWSPWKSERPGQRVEVLTGDATIEAIDTKNPMDIRWTTYAKSDALIRLNTLYYPGWTAQTDGKPTAIDYQTDGAIQIAATKGIHRMDVIWRETRLRTVADAISLLSLFWIISSGILEVVCMSPLTRRPLKQDTVPGE